MSRSYRKHWVIKDRDGSSGRAFSKRRANRKVRKTLEISDGKAYRKVFDPWNIYDWIIRYSDRFDGDEFWKWKFK